MPYTRRSYLGVAGGAATSAALSGCMGDFGPGDGSGTLEPDSTSVDLVLNWQPSGLHAPYYAAVDRGFYEEAGFDGVSIESGQGSDFAAQQAALGNATFAVSSSDQVLNVTSEGLSPLAVGVIMQRNPVVVFAPRERLDGLADPAALSGATLGSGPGMVRQMTEAYLEHHGVLESVEYVDSGFDTVQQLLTGEIDAAAGVFGDVVDAEHQGYEISTLSVHETIPSYGHLLATSANLAEDEPETVRAFLRATARGGVWATRNPEAAIDTIVDAKPELAEVRSNQLEKWNLLRAEYALSATVREHGWGYSEPDPWRRTHEILEAGDVFGGSVDPDAVWTNEYLDADHEYVGDYADLVEERS